jgi:hypothetical protein
VRYRLSGHCPHKDGQPARGLAVGTPAFPPKDSGTRSAGHYSLFVLTHHSSAGSMV